MRHFFALLLKLSAGLVMIFYGQYAFLVWYWAIASWVAFFALLNLSYKVEHNSRRWY